MKGAHVTYSDNTRYRIVNDLGTLVRDPRKVGGRERKKLRRAARRGHHVEV